MRPGSIRNEQTGILFATHIARATCLFGSIQQNSPWHAPVRLEGMCRITGGEVAHFQVFVDQKPMETCTIVSREALHIVIFRSCLINTFKKTVCQSVSYAPSEPSGIAIIVSGPPPDRNPMSRPSTGRIRIHGQERSGCTYLTHLPDTIAFDEMISIFLLWHSHQEH